MFEIEANMQSSRVSKSEFKAKALEYFRQIESTRTSVVITDHGKPVLEVRPYRDVKRNPLELLHGTVVAYDNPTEPVSVDWETQL